MVGNFISTQALHIVATQNFEHWDAKTQRSVMLLSKPFLAEFQPHVTQANAYKLVGLDRLPALRILNYHPDDDDEEKLTSRSTVFTALTRLQYLSISYALVEDLTPLSSCTALRSLEVSRVDYLPLGSTAAALLHLPHLTSLELRGHARLTELEPLSILTQLKHLSVEHNFGLPSLTPLAALTNLEQLNINHTFVSCLHPLAGLTRLKVLHLRSTPIRDLEPLTTLQQLSVLDAWGGNFSDNLTRVDPLSRLTNMQHLDLGSAWLSPLWIPPLMTLTRLTSLSLHARELRGGLEGLAGLTQLDLAGSMPEGFSKPMAITPLSSLVQLTSLALDSTAVVDVEILTQLKQLCTLGLAYVADITPLSKLVSLKKLNLRDSRVQHVGALGALTQLKELNLSRSQWMSGVSQIGPLSVLTQLEALNLRNTAVKDMGPLAHMVKLREVDLRGTEPIDKRPLAALTQFPLLAAWFDAQSFRIPASVL